MAIIPANEKVFMVSNGTNTTYGGSAALQAMNQWYTMQDISDSVGAVVLPYKVYTALLTQTGTNAPVATVLENTLGGDIIWSYSGTGSYLGTLAGAFTSQKTFFYVYGEATYNNGPNIYNQKIRDINIINNGLIGLNQTELTFTNGVFSSAGNTNSFSNIPIEIRVYN